MASLVGRRGSFLATATHLGNCQTRRDPQKVPNYDFQHRHDHFFSTIIILIKGDFNDLHDLRRQPSRSSLMSTFSQGVKDKFAVGFLFLFLVKTIFFPFLVNILHFLLTFNHFQSVLPASFSKNPEQNKLRLLV